MMKRFRYMLANLIAGGELDWLKDNARFWQGLRTEALIEKFDAQAANARALELIERMEGVISNLEGQRMFFLKTSGVRYAALQRIIACDTPSSNGTVKRMVRIAREALK